MKISQIVRLYSFALCGILSATMLFADEAVPKEKADAETPQESSEIPAESILEEEEEDSEPNTAGDVSEQEESPVTQSPVKQVGGTKQVVVEVEPVPCECGTTGECECQDKGKTAQSIGGFRYRYIDEDNRLRPDGPDRSTYQQWRLLLEVEVGISESIDLFLEGIDASTFDENMPELLTDVNRSDLVQGYLDINLYDDSQASLRTRIGRQLLEYGAERLVSPFDWANTLRNFDGFKLYYESEKLKVDGFALQAVNWAAGNEKRQPTSFDNPDEHRWFSGLYTALNLTENQELDLYWLWLKDEIPSSNRLDGNRHTFGIRWAGEVPVFGEDESIARTWFWDGETGWQRGTDDFQGTTEGKINAGFFTLSAGHRWDALDWSPSIKGSFYWGSGDDDPLDGSVKTFSPLYPDSHRYWGIMDNLSGSNLIDYSLQAEVRPSKFATLGTAFHWFRKAEGSDFIYDVNGFPVGPTGTDREIGNELDFLITLHHDEEAEIQIGISTFWYGDAVTETALTRPDAQQFYIMYTAGY